jgi:peptide-methionine (S)-S-oxide reductase
MKTTSNSSHLLKREPSPFNYRFYDTSRRRKTLVLVQYLISILVILSIHMGKNLLSKSEKTTFGAGCFWCVEAVFERLDGVQSVVAGYAGGTTADPDYKAVCTGKTGHAEVVQITYSPAMISYERLLQAFWECHDPTTMNQQGADIGTQYRSVIFYHDENQKRQAEKTKYDTQKNLHDPIVTQILPLTGFYPAEDYHQDYYKNNPDAPYCRLVISPKLKKLFKNK